MKINFHHISEMCRKSFIYKYFYLFVFLGLSSQSVMISIMILDGFHLKICSVKPKGEQSKRINAF